MYLLISGLWCKTLEVIFISEYQAHELLIQMFSVIFGYIFLYCAYHTKYRVTNRKYSFVFKQEQSINVPVYYKYSKLILIQVTIILSVCCCLLLWKSPLSSASLQPVESLHSSSINSCSTILLPIHSKLMSHHHQDSNLLAIQGLAHSETDIIA